MDAVVSDGKLIFKVGEVELARVWAQREGKRSSEREMERNELSSDPG